VLSHGLIAQTHVDAVVIKEENAVAAPILKDRVNGPQRQSFVAPRVNKKKVNISGKNQIR
jgi:hypothetical protein